MRGRRRRDHERVDAGRERASSGVATAATPSSPASRRGAGRRRRRTASATRRRATLASVRTWKAPMRPAPMTPMRRAADPAVCERRAPRVSAYSKRLQIAVKARLTRSVSGRPGRAAHDQLGREEVVQLAGPAPARSCPAAARSRGARSRPPAGGSSSAAATCSARAAGRRSRRSRRRRARCGRSRRSR